MDLRVEDNPRPLAELKRLVTLWRAYRKEDEGDSFIAEGKVPEALQAYTTAAKLAPGNMELLFWQAVTLWKLGKEREATPIFRKVFASGPQWVTLVPRLAPAGLLEDDPASMRRIQALAPAPKRKAR
jgi:tetratricopeptide (TPR) repeat protein